MACECGCGEDAVNGSYKPGHDQKLRISLERRVGGLSNMRALVESAEQFKETKDAVTLATKISLILELRQNV
jgi:hypothetical protein